MRILTFQYLKVCLFLGFLSGLSFTANAQWNDYADFESGWGIWNDGGSDAYRLDNPTYSASGNFTARIRDNSGGASSIYTDNLSLSGVSLVVVEFTYFPASMENGEDLSLIHI